MRTDLPAIIDLEASGFGRGSYPIEVGYVLPEGGNYCTLILPAAHWLHWDDTAQQVHRITRDVLLSHGRTADAAASRQQRRPRAAAHIRAPDDDGGFRPAVTTTHAAP